MTIIVAIANAKGGTAKTTTAVALAGEAAHRGSKTLLVDLDVQANSTEHLLGPGAGDDGKSVQRAILDGDPLDVVATKVANLAVAAGGRRTQDLADGLMRMVHEADPERLAEAYNTVRATLHDALAAYDVVIVDTPPSEQSATLIDFVFAVATHIVLPTKIDQNSTKAISAALTQLVKLSRRGATVGDPVGILLVDVDTAAKRLTAEALGAVDHIGAIVEPFAAVVSHRSNPVANGRRAGLTPREFVDAAAEAQRRRFAALRSGAHEENPTWDPNSARKLVDDYAAVYDELLARIAAEDGR